MLICNDVTRDLGDLQREPPVAGGLSRPIFTTSPALAQHEGTSDLQGAPTTPQPPRAINAKQKLDITRICSHYVLIEGVFVCRKKYLHIL
jgi:hypothetical protein